jgi:hypothetical protein
MAFNGKEQEAIVELMAGKYAQILPIEEEWHIRLHEGDMRARIEHFHDAVRALTSGEVDLHQKNSRLSVEHLAYDIAQLRMVQDKPVGKINRVTEKSAGSELVRAGEAGATRVKHPPQTVRAHIVALYRDYTVFFAALFAEVSDINYQSRVDAIDGAVEDLALLEQVIKQLAAGKISTAQALDEIMHVEHDDLRERLQVQLGRKQVTASEKQQIMQSLGLIQSNLDKEKKSIETAHMHYATSQLAVYEESKETIKRMNNAGLNLAGKFVETAMQAAGKGKDKGRGA